MNVKVEPAPTWLLTLYLLRCCPDLPEFLEHLLVILGAMPIPVSLTVTSTNPSFGTAPTSMRPPSGVNPKEVKRAAFVFSRAAVMGNYARTAVILNAVDQQARGLDFHDPLLRTELGIFLFRLGRHDEALSELQIALAIDPHRSRARAGRCAVLARRDRFDEAISDCTEAIRLAPNEAALFTARGEVYRRKGDLDRAIEDYDAALRIDQKHRPALYGRGLAKRTKGDHAGAEADVAAALTISPRVAD
ncbi:MAG: tetratricopeptide repeat protein [Candidatus Rokuibacteriota bacterium]